MKVSRVQLFRGVHNPESLIEQIRAYAAGDGNAGSYLRGSLQYLERFPPNKLIAPLLRKTLNEFGRR
jgi:hypothetical protein